MGRGRPAYEATPKNKRMVESLAAFGITEVQICDLLRIDLKTLRKYYRSELDTGHVKMISQVAQSLFRTAISREAGHVEAAKFILSRRGGQAWAVPVAEATTYVSKKEEAQWAAKRAGLGSEWDEDLISTPPPQPSEIN